MDDTNRLLWSIANEPGKWSRRRVVAFVPHERSFPAQKLSNGDTIPAQTIRVTEADLERDADRANERQRRSGQLDTVTIGHRKFDPNYPEHKQPVLAGFARDYRVETVQREGGRFPALTYEECVPTDVLREHNLYREYPYRSAEYSPELGINGVAVLKRPPALNMGTIYVYQGSPMSDTAMGDDQWGPDDDAGYPEFQTYAAKHGMPRLKKYMAKYEAGTAAPGATNTDVPATYAADALIRTYQAKFDAMFAEQKARADAAEKRAQSAEWAARLDKMAGMVKFDPAREIKTLMAYQSDEDRNGHVKYMLDTYEKLPTGGMFRVYEGPTPSQKDAGQSQVPDIYREPADYAKVMTYMRAHPGLSYDQAEAAVIAGK